MKISKKKLMSKKIALQIQTKSTNWNSKTKNLEQKLSN